jgi:hypothetical protein
MIAMRRCFPILLVCAMLLTSLAAQDWKHVHKADDEKWAKETGLDPWTVHKIWRTASSASEEKDDDSRIANLDIEGLAERHDVLLVTYAGEKNCLTITVLRQLTESKFSKVWSVTQLPDGTAFCDNEFGSPQAEAADGIVTVRTFVSAGGSVQPVTYAYEWNGITYRFAGKRAAESK